MTSLVSLILQPSITQWSQRSGALEDLLGIYGSAMDQTRAKQWLRAFAEADFSGLPPVITLSAERMPGLWGGYSREKNRIYISSDCPPEHLAAVLLEEVGHFLDRELCVCETTGEEGARFAAVVLGQQPSAEQLATWAKDEGFSWVLDQGGPVLVEGAKKKSGGGGKKNSGGSNSDGGGKKKKSNNSKSGGSSEKRKKSRSSPPADSGGGGSSSGGAAPVASQPPKPSDFQDDPVQSYPGETLTGSSGSTFVVSDPANVTIGGNLTGTETIETDADGLNLENFNQIENVILTGVANISAKGNSLGNVITGNAGNNNLSGGEGNDTLVGLAGNDSLDGGTGNDSMVGGTGNDTFIVDAAGDVVVEVVNEGTDVVKTSVDYVLAEHVEALELSGVADIDGTGNSLGNTITGNSGSNFLDGLGGDDTISGAGGNDTMLGGAGNDSLDGGTGNDSLIGGAGDDTFVVDSDTDSIVENANEGTDVVWSSLNYSLGDNLENLVLTGSAISGTGNSLSNSLTGNSVGNSLDGGTGIDTMIGAQGNDTYFVDHTSDVVTEISGEGTDLVVASESYALANHVEHLVLTGTAIAGTGNSLNNSITGNSIGNSLEGGSGVDTLIGGSGNDTYIVDTASDRIVEDGGDAVDLVVSSVSFNLSNALVGGGNTVENLQLTGTAVSGTGNALNNLLTGNSGNNLLTGNGGNDTFIGGEGNDTFIGDTGADSMVGGVGADSMVGGGGADTFVGGAGNDTIVVNSATSVTVDGGADNDTLKFVSTSGMTLGDSDFGGYSNIESYDFTSVTGNVDITIGLNAQNLGIATLAGGTANSTLTANSSYSGSVHFTGGALADSLTGNSGNDTLAGAGGNDTIVGGSGADSIDGGTGNDSMVGGLGNDTYVVDSASDVIVENASEGTDVVRSSESYTLGSNIESLELTGTSDINGTGDALANTITGNSGNNVLAGEGGNDTLIGGAGNDSLDGGTGNDSMVGGAGDDTFVVDSATDVVVEATGEGTDELRASINFTLGSNLERLVLTGTAVSGTGNILANTVTGNASANSLDGGAGIDSLIGGAGDDTYFVDNASEVVVEASGEGTDLVISSVSGYTLASHVENLELASSAIAGTGNSLNNMITGNSVGNSLDGGSGVDTLIGGSGNDTYFIDTTTEMIVETGSDSADVVVASVFFDLSSTLAGGGNSIENLQLTGTAVSGTGNALNNTLTGNSVGNSLNGGAGIDMMIGGQGNDTYFVDNATEVVTELSGEGTDLVVASVTGYTLASNVEQLQLAGAVVGGTGNSLANTLTGNATGNSLDGGSGIDSLIGGVGNDTYVVDNASDAVFENTDEGEDLVESSVNYTLSANVEKLTLTGTAVSAMGNSLTNTLTGNASANSLDGGSGIDSMVGGAGNDTYFVDNVGDVVFENASEGTDVVVTTVDGYTMASEIENLVIGGTGNLAGSGSAGNNLLTGNSGNNLLTGNGGNDTFIGGEGNDTLVGDTGADSMVGGVGADSMVGGGGADTFVGGAGNDTIVVSFGDAVTVDGGADNDTVKFESSIGRTVGDTFFGGFSNIESYDFTSVTGNVDITIGLNAQNLGIATLAGGTANSTLTANSSYSGSVHFTGGALADSLTGNSGNDTLAGAGENDTIVGGSGADSLDGGTGNDSMVGGTGNDTYVVDSALDVIVENASEGTDVVRSSVSYTLGSNIESLELTGTANIDGTGDALANTITGNSGNNVLAGEGGNDTLIGGAGNDSLDGGIGNDSMVGGAGDDTFVVDSATDVVVEAAGDGTDLVQTGISYTLGSNFENLELTGTSNINGTGNDLDNSITGNSGNNTLAGGDGNDTISGGGGDDSLYGGAGGDSLVGGSGNDTLKAGTGNDHMDGGDNDDSFLFSSDTQVLANTVVGGAGTDTLVLTAATTITDPQLVRVSGVEVLQASSLAGNSITLGANALASGVSTLKGGAAGGDTLSAAGYTGTNAKIWIDASGSTLGSTLIAGLGDPAFTGGNTLLGGLGSDLIQVATSAVLNNASIIGGTGTDTVQVTTDAQVVGDTDLDSLSGIEALQLANGANSITLGDKARGIATVTGGLDIIAMGSGSDTLTATAAFGTTAITLDGGAGDDRFVFDTATQMAAATLLGGTGTDTLALAQATVLGNGTAFLNVTGMDVLQAAATGESSFVLDASAQAAGIRTVIGGSGKGTLNASAYSVDVTLDASANANTTANNGATLLGGTGNNSFRMLNNNVLSVSSIVGGSASDTLSFTQDGLSITDGNFTRVQGVEALRTGNGTNYVNLGSNAATAGLKTLVGGTGADTLDAAAFSGATLAIDSGNGADFITGSSTAANSILSGAGNDSITLANAAAVGRSTVVGGADTDTLSLAGNDTLTDAQLANVSGVEVLSAAATGNSSLTVGTNAQALGLRIVLGGGGNDTLNAVAFTAGVTLNGGAGNDSLLVSSGAILGQSSVVGGIGTDTLALTIDALSITDADFTRVSTVEVFKTANGNNRVLLGTAAQTAGIATVVGGSGKDTLDANAFTQALVLDGGQGDNSLFGGAGNDSLISYDGADALDGGVGIDTMIGGKGSDTYYLGDDDEWIVENEATGAGANYIIVQDNVSSYNTLTGGGDATFVVSALVEQIGTDGNDTLVGTPLKDTISGLGGDDVITGDRGADSLLGGDGNDSISGGGASDTILGGANNDTLLGDAGSDSIEGGDGTDSIFGGADNDTILGNNGNDTLLGEAGSDSILGGDGFDSILGGADNDTILGGNDNDTILGGDGNDSILGGIGNDSLIAGTGIDTLDGEDGDDTFVADATGTSRFLGGDGNDNFRFSTPSLVGLNTIVGDDGNDTISTDTIWLLAGGTLNDADLLHVSAIEVLDASGLNAENAITANLGVSAFSAGISTLTGSNQADYLSAAEYISGSIWIRGYNGATSNGDSLVAGSGSNSSTLVGSNEADYFEVGLASLVGNHSIDGGSGTDTLSIKNIAYGQAGWNPGNQVFSDADFTKVRNIERLQYDNRYQNTLVFGENLAAAFSGDIFIYSTTETNPSDGIGDDGRDVIDLSGITSITKKVNLDVRHEVFGATITAATTNGTLMGGSGVFADDLFIFEQASWLSGAMIVGGDGEDTLRIQGNGYFGLNDINTADFKIDIDVLDITGAGNEIILTTDPDNTDITTVVGGSGPNTFTAASYGGLGAKTLYWDMRRSDGGDSIVGAATNDYFQIRNGSNLQNSIITGGTGGTDTLALLSGGETLGDAIFDNASNLDVLVLGSAANGNNITLGATHAQTAGIATVIGGTRSETINASAYTTAIYIDASASSGARLQGSSTANANTLIGASAGSNEFEVGSLGSNSIVGGASGVDTLTFVNSTDIEDLIQNSQINDLSTASLSNIGVLKFTGNDNDITLGNDGLAAGIRTLVGGEGGDLGSTFDTSLYGTVGVVFQVTDQVYLKNSNITGGTGVDTLKFSRDGVSITDENVANLRNIDVLRTANGNNRFLFDDDYLTAGIETIIGGTGRDTIDMASNVLYTPGSDADIITVDLSAGSGYTLISSTGNFRWAKVIGGSATGSVILDGTSLADADFANMYQANIGSIFMRSGSNNTVVLGENALASGLDALTMSLGNDFINASGFAGTLAISGGAGNDRVETSFASLSNLTYTGGEGVDRLQLVGAEARSFTSLAGNFEVLELNAGNNFVILGNDASLSAIHGGTGIDTISMLSNTTGIEFVMDATRLGATAGFASLDGGSGMDTLTVRSVDTTFVDNQFARVGSVNWADDIGAIENFVTEAGVDDAYTFGRNAYDAGIRNVYAGARQVLNAAAFNDGDPATTNDRALNFVFDTAANAATANITGTSATGNDTLTLTTDGQTVNNATFANKNSVETLVLANGANTVTLQSNAHNSGLRVVVGGSGADIFNTSDAAYTLAASLVGGAGNDSFVAGSGNDTLVGTNSTAVGANERDTLTGGLGNDRFVLGDSNNAYYNTAVRNGDYAVITDFGTGTDIIQLKDLSAIITNVTARYGYLMSGVVDDVHDIGDLGIGIDSYLYADSDNTGTITINDNLIAVFNNTDGVGGALTTADLTTSRFSIV